MAARTVDALSAAEHAALSALAGSGLVTPCSACGRRSVTSPDGRPAICLPCTEREIGLSVHENADRIERGWSVARYLRHPAGFPLPLARSSATKRRLAHP